MKRIFLLAGLVSLSLLTGCGYGNSNNGGGSNGGGGGITPQGNFSVASLSGQYTYQLTGTFIAPNFPSFADSGIFTADGKGNISAGTDDLVPNSVITSSFTGTYSLANDGTGFVQLDNGLEFAITMVSSSKFYLTEIDGTANASGTGEQQTTAAVTATAVPNGTFVFRIHNDGTLKGAIAQVGAMTLTSGIATGNEDVIASGGNASAQTLTASFNAPTSGRGNGTLTDSNGTLTFQYYLIDANTINIMPSALNAVSILGTGRAELQTGTFSQGSLSGGYAFGSRGDTTLIGGSQTVGRFTAGGDGNISEGQQDFVLNNVSGAKDSFTGTYTMASNGRATVNLTSSSLGTVPERLWMVSPTRAFFLVDDAARVEDGTIDTQSSTSFSNASLTGQSAFSMSGNNGSDLIDRVGTLIWDGSGGVTVNEVINATGSANNAVIPGGTAQVSSNGRVVGNVSGLSTNLIFYLISNGSGYMLQNDTNTEIGGTASLQSQ